MIQNAEALQKILSRAASNGTLLEVDVYDLLEAMGLAVPQRVLLLLDEAARLTEAPSLPSEYVFLKLQASGLLHKTEAGGVRRVLCDAESIRHTIREMIASSGMKREQITGVLAVEEIEADRGAGGLELLLGARRTHDFGPIITLGQGGIGAEFWSRLSEAHGPTIASAKGFDKEKASWFLDRVLIGSLWRGYRGSRRLVDDGEIATWLIAWAGLIDYFDGSTDERRPRILEAEINPLVIRNAHLLPLDGLVRVDPDYSEEMAESRSESLSLAGSEIRTDTESVRVEALERLLLPKTVAIAGVSASRMNPGRTIMLNLLGEAWDPSNLAVIKPGSGQSGDLVDGVTCYNSIGDVPFQVDLYVLAVSADETLTMLRDAAGCVSSALLIAGGTSERSGKADLGEQLGTILDETGITALGPNSLGMISRPARVDTLFLPKSKLPRAERDPAPFAYISQSGAFMITRMNRTPGLEPRYAISTGNQLRTGVADVLATLARDPEVQTFAVYVEGFGSQEGLRFREVARRVIREGRRVILYKAGRTEHGASAASGHTASIAGDDRVCHQLLAEVGVIQADTFEEFGDFIRMSCGWSERSVGKARFAAVSNAGFECVGMADALGPPLQPVTFSQATVAKVREALAIRKIDQLVDVRNPVDLTPMADADTWLGAVEVLLNDDEIDLLIVSPVPPTPAFQSLPKGSGHQEDLESPEAPAARLREAARTSRKPIAFVVDGGPMYDPFAEALGRNGTPVFRSADRAVRVIRRFVEAITTDHRSTDDSDLN